MWSHKMNVSGHYVTWVEYIYQKVIMWYRRMDIYQKDYVARCLVMEHKPNL